MTENELGIGSRIRHLEFGEGVVINVKPRTYVIIFLQRGRLEVSRNYVGLEVIEALETEEGQVSMADVERIITGIIRKYSDIQETVQIGSKWTGGKLVLQPGNSALKGKEVPIDIFFNKIIMLRDRLRVMEQRINANDKLSEEDKVNLQQYLTRIYGSLTTFNVLFKDDEDYFVGEKGKD
ncbi:MAG TPA: hypothetical protein VFW78_03830 [Bacteroidia bacterium]|nr:hypothetical protein [Bacteroidia bacterium]